MELQWYFYVGLIAAVCISIYCMPQLIYVIRTKDTCGISIWMLVLMLAGDVFFVVQAIGMWIDPNYTDNISGALPILLANGTALLIGSILFTYKIKARRWSRYFKVSEKEFCNNHATYKAKIQMIKAEKKAKKAADESTPTNKVLGA